MLKLWRVAYFLALGMLSFPLLEGGVWGQVKDVFCKKPANRPPTVQVLIVRGVDRVPVAVQGKYSLYDPRDGTYISSRYVGKMREFEPMRDGLRWGEAFPGLYQIQIVPDEASTYTVVDGLPYEGILSVYDVEGTVSIVNEVSLESFVGFMLAGQPEIVTEPELLAALAIVLRTNAYYASLNPKSAYWALDGEKISFPGEVPLNPEIRSVLDITRGMVMSRSSVYDRVIHPFGAYFNEVPVTKIVAGEASAISWEKANEMAKQGANAAQILNQAFPKSTILLLPRR